MITNSLDTYNLISLNNFKLKEETNKSLKAQEEGNQKIKQDLESKITGLRNNFENNNSSINQKINSVIIVLLKYFLFDIKFLRILLLKLDNSTSQKINEQNESITNLKNNFNRDIDKIKAETEENSKDVNIVLFYC
jgi:hypothetical protein